MFEGNKFLQNRATCLHTTSIGPSDRSNARCSGPPPRGLRFVEQASKDASTNDISKYRQLYAAGHDPARALDEVRNRLLASGVPGISLHIASFEALGSFSVASDPASRPCLPLWGVLFAIKDNTDVADMPITAAYPAFSSTSTHPAPSVARLIAAAAIPVGKTNMDQLATGLNGTRTPHPASCNLRLPGRIPGVSSSGSAVAVPACLGPIALGTDSAGSGRVPAGLCGIVGLKPTPSAVSTRGVLPACRSLDCVSVLANTVADGWAVHAITTACHATRPRHISACPSAPRSTEISGSARLQVSRRVRWAVISPAQSRGNIATG